MNRVTAPWRDALDLWAVRVLAAFSLRLRVSVFLAGFVAAVCFATAVAAGLVFTVVTAARAAAVEAVPDSADAFAWGVVVVLVGVLAYLAVGSVLREAFSRVRYTVPASPVRGLWLALDLPLRQVLAAERGTEQVPRLLLAAGSVAGAAGALAVAGAPGAALAALGALGVAVAGEAAAHLVARRAASRVAERRVPTGLWELYLTVLGLAVGALLPGLARLVGGVDVTGAADRLSGVDASALRAGGVAAVVVGLGAAVVTAVRLARGPVHDVPVLAFDAPTIIARRVSLWPRPGRAGVVEAVARGTGSMAVQPAVLTLVRVVLALTAVAAGVGWVAGPVLAGVTVGSVPLDAGARVAAVLVFSALAGFVTSAAVVVAGQDARLWHYRALWELGARPVTVWAAHLTGALVQCVVVGLLGTLAVAALTGHVGPEVLVVTVTSALADHLADSLFARASRDEGDARSGSTALAVVSLALVAPSLLGALVGGWWLAGALVYVVLLAVGGFWCFAVRLRNVPVVATE